MLLVVPGDFVPNWSSSHSHQCRYLIHDPERFVLNRQASVDVTYVQHLFLGCILLPLIYALCIPLLSVLFEPHLPFLFPTNVLLVHSYKRLTI